LSRYLAFQHRLGFCLGNLRTFSVIYYARISRKNDRKRLKLPTNMDQMI
jgi:hypothetical protein